jgi:hypothetical protein
MVYGTLSKRDRDRNSYNQLCSISHAVAPHFSALTALLSPRPPGIIHVQLEGGPQMINDALDCLVLYTIVALALFGLIHLTEALSLFRFPIPPSQASFPKPSRHIEEVNQTPLNAMITLPDIGYHDA